MIASKKNYRLSWLLCVLTLFVLGLPVVGFSQTGLMFWANRYDGPGDSYDNARSIIVGGNGNVYVTGGSGGSGNSEDYSTIAYTSAGAPLWTNRYNGPGNNSYANSIVVSSNGNVYVTGSSVGFGSSSDYATIAYTSAGASLWTNRYNGPGNGYDYASSIAVGSNGNVYVTGYSFGSGSGNDYATIAYSSAGLPLWTNRYNGPGNGDDSASGIVVGSNGNVYVTGVSQNVSGYNDYATIAYSSAGLPLWTNRYNVSGNYGGQANSIAVGSNGNVYVTGYYYFNGAKSSYATIAYGDLPHGMPFLKIDGQFYYYVVASAINSSVVTMTSTYDDGLIYYTLDGSAPDFTSAIYTGPITLTNFAVVRALGLDANTFDTAEAPAVTVNIIHMAYPVAAQSAGGGRASVTPVQADYLSNSIVSITATASNGWTFLNWSGDASGTNNPLSFTVNAPATNLQAVFGTTIFANVTGNGSVQLDTPNPVAFDAIVQATAIPSNGWYFVQWSGALSGTNNPSTFAVTSTNPVSAQFAIVAYPVATITVGGGQASMSPVQANYASNSTVTITATASNGWTFLNWSGDASGTNNPLSFTVNATATNIQAVFGTPVMANVIGNGTVQLSASNLVAYRTTVQATAVPSNGVFFLQWSGAATGTNNPVNFAVTGTNAVVGIFSPPVAVSTLGGGRVTAALGQINYPNPSVASVTAIASNGWSFLDWSGDASGSSNPLNLTLDSAKNVAAVFGTAVGMAVIGNGSIELSPANLVAYGSVVRAAATANNGSYFVQWGGVLTGTNSPAEFTVTSTNLARAIFTALPASSAALTIRVNGGGDVAVLPRKSYYAQGESVTLMATARGATNQFIGWSGDAGGTTNSLSLTLNTSKAVTANFVAALPRLQANVLAGTGVQLNLAGFPGQSYVLQAATNLTLPILWQSLWTNLADNNGNWQFTDTNLNQTQKFYRVTVP